MWTESANLCGMAAPLLHVRVYQYIMTMTTTTTKTNALATKNGTQGARTSEPLEVIDNNGEVVFAIAVTTHE